MPPSLLAPLASVLPSMSLGGAGSSSSSSSSSSSAAPPSTPRGAGKAALAGAAELGADDDLAARLPVSGIDWADEPSRPKSTPRSSSSSSSSSRSAARANGTSQPALHFPSTPIASTSSATAFASGSSSVERSHSGSSTPTLSAQRLRASSAALSDLSSALKAQKVAAANAERRRSVAAAAAAPSTPSTPSAAAATPASQGAAVESKRTRFLSLPSKRPSLPWLNSYTSTVRRALPRLPTSGVDIGEALGVEEPLHRPAEGADERATSPPPSYEHARKAPPPPQQPHGLASPLMLPASRSSNDVNVGMLDSASSSLGAASSVASAAPAASAETASDAEAEATTEEQEEEAEEQDAEYLVDLYVTSLTHLLSALPSDLAKSLPPRQREALLAALREAERKVQPTETAVVRRSDVMDAQPAARGATRHEHVHAHHVYHHNPPLAAASPSQLKELPAPPSPSLEVASTATAAPATASAAARVTSALAMPAFELLLSITAASISLASRGAANLVDVSTSSSTAVARRKPCACDSPSSSSAPTSPRTATDRQLALLEGDSKAATIAAEEEKKIKGKGLPSEWEGPLALARAAAGMMYAQMASASTQTAGGGGGKVESKKQASSSTSSKPASRKATSLPTSPRLGLSSLAEEETALVRAADVPAATNEGSLPSLARALKRSPLPAALSSSLSLLSASAERLGVRERAADVAIKGASSGLRYVREHELHLYAMRSIWEGMEECVKALEAYREEEGWAGGRKRLEA